MSEPRDCTDWSDDGGCGCDAPDECWLINDTEELLSTVMRGVAALRTLRSLTHSTVPPEVVEALSRPHELRVQHWRSTKDDDRYTLMQLAARREASVIRLIPDGQEVVVVSQERWDTIDRFIRGER